jgi:hypothetical protein
MLHPSDQVTIPAAWIVDQPRGTISVACSRESRVCDVGCSGFAEHWFGADRCARDGCCPDEVSAALTSLFSDFGKEFQALSAQAGLFHQQFVQALKLGAGSYAASDAAAAAALQTLEHDVVGVINAPTNTLLGRPLIGNGGAAGSIGKGGSGGGGGLLATVGQGGLLFGANGTNGVADTTTAASTGGASTGGTGGTTAATPAVTSATGAAPTSNNIVPITMVNTTEPVVNLRSAADRPFPCWSTPAPPGLSSHFKTSGDCRGCSSSDCRPASV